jgi:hypothetical protein
VDAKLFFILRKNQSRNMYYRYWLIIISFLSVGCVASQNTKTDQPNLSVKNTVSNYWQQHVDYKMDIDMHVKNHQYTGIQKLIYTNNSPDALYKVFYHLYFNAFQPGSEMDARLQTILDPDRRMVTDIGSKNKPIFQSRISMLKPDEIGFIKVQSLKLNGQKLNYKVQGTILEVTLNKPINPGDKVVFEMDFIAQVPLQIRRSGRNNRGGVAYSMTQWYPKMVEYDFEGWHADPYIGREFYGVWGDYDVTIHIDKDYMLGGTGYIQNPQEVGFGYENKDLKLSKPKKDKIVWHFNAPNVHDFTWVADKDFVHDTQQLKNGTLIHFLYKNKPSIKKNWKKMQPIAVKTMEFYNDFIGKYAYNQYSIIQGGDGGMEYAMCTLVTANRRFEGLVGTVMHEMAHAWFQFSLATNESKHEWMDEGFASFVEALASDKIMRNKGDFVFESAYNYYYYMANTRQEEPLTTHADRYETNMSYGINAYDKGLVFLSQLGYIIGWKSLEKTLKDYYKVWSGKHPSPNDFIRIAEKTSGIELDWYLNEFTQTTHSIDYAIENIDNKSISLKRIGQIPMPIDIEVTYIDNTKENFYIPLNLMLGEKQTDATLLDDWAWAYPTYSFKVLKEVKKVRIDPTNLLADIDKKNNRLSR